MSTAISVIDQTTILSLVLVLILLLSAYFLSTLTLHASTPTRLRILFIWHFFDFLIHTIFEGSFIYNCFFSSSPYNPAIHHPVLITNFLNAPDKIYGAVAGNNWASKLWMVYAQADKRWAGVDLTVVSLELLTVLGAGPLALYVCWALVRRDPSVGFWMVVLATGELYGGMSFPPPNLSSFVFYNTWFGLS
jgi:hypothetical protein